MNRLVVFVTKCRLWVDANGCSKLEEWDKEGVSQLKRAELETSTRVTSKTEAESPDQD